MEIIYSVGARFGGYGFGYTAYNIASRLHQKVALKKIIALTLNKNVCDWKKILTMGLFGTLLEKCPNQVLRDNLFDFYASLRVEKCDIFHGWAHQALFSIKKAKNLNAITFIERASSHILTQQRLMREESEKLGIRRKAIPELVIKKCLKEYRDADFICVPSRFVYDSFIENGIDRNKLLMLPYGVDFEHFRPGEKSDDIFRVLYVGLISFRKGVRYLLEAWSRLNLKNAELVLAGPILKEFKEVFRRYQSLPNIRYVGFARNIENYYQQSSVLVLPSIEDGFGLVVLEAMACGIPVIVSNNVGARDVIEDGKEGFMVPSADIDSLIEKIEFFYRNPETLVLMGKAARLKAECYSWNNTAEILIEHYTEKCGKRK